MNPAKQELKIHDIKDLVEIPDWSFLFFIILIIIGLLVFTVIIYFVINFIKKRKGSQRKKWYNILKQLDLNDTKTSAYTITKYGFLLAKSDREKRLIEQINNHLQSHKYKKDVKPLTKQIRSEVQIFLESIDV